jgi:RNA polymerase sigma factor, sigma-70 family
MRERADSSDEQLMLAYATGDARAFDTLYARHKGGIYRYLLRQCRDAGIAEQLFQDVWMNLIRVRASYQPSAKFTTWLYTLAHNRLIDHHRATGRVTLVSTDDESHADAIRRTARKPPQRAGVARVEPRARCATQGCGGRSSGCPARRLSAAAGGAV